MDILIFDMDGVLLQAQGYHRALQQTVKKAADYLSLEGIELTQDDIHRFESLGISSEWHSSALCMDFLEIQLRSGTIPSLLKLDELFSALKDEPLHLPALQRGLTALRRISARYGVDFDEDKTRVANSGNIDQSLTLNWFQEHVLGSAAYQERYNKQAYFNSPSYLEMYDIPLLSPGNAERITHLQEIPGRGAAIMTNRPSSGPVGFSGSPEAEMGMALVGLEEIPLIGYGEMCWLAESLDRDPEELIKPHPSHALAAIFNSIGFGSEESLKNALGDLPKAGSTLARKLRGKSITVFEDTPAGVRSVQHAGELLGEAGMEVRVQMYGIAQEETKIQALESVGALVFPDINTALANLEDF
jgi:beta-phosphoglucomutase-like phosphatase (HAD superfamily)